MKKDGWLWSIFFARWILGLIFFMAGFWKVFQLGPLQHASRFFVAGYSDSWIPLWLLWGLGTIIPFVELAAGGLLCVGLQVRSSLVALGMVLVVVTYGHLLADPLFDFSAHVIPRLGLLLFLLAAPASEDRLSVDFWLKKKAAASHQNTPKTEAPQHSSD